MVRFDGRPCVEEYAAVCTVSKGASRLKKCGKKHRAAGNFENRVEGQRLLFSKHHGRYVVTDFAFSQEIWKLSDTTHLRSNHAKDHDWERFGNSKPSIVFNAQRVMTGNILLVSSSMPARLLQSLSPRVFCGKTCVTFGMNTGGCVC